MFFTPSWLFGNRYRLKMNVANASGSQWQEALSVAPARLIYRLNDIFLAKTRRRENNNLEKSELSPNHHVNAATRRQGMKGPASNLLQQISEACCVTLVNMFFRGTEMQSCSYLGTNSQYYSTWMNAQAAMCLPLQATSACFSSMLQSKSLAIFTEKLLSFHGLAFLRRTSESGRWSQHGNSHPRNPARLGG